MCSNHIGQAASAAPPQLDLPPLQTGHIISQLYPPDYLFSLFVHSNNQTWFPLGFAVTLVDHVHGGAEVPHLNAPVCMASEEVPAGSGAHTARAFTLSHCKARDGGAIYSLHLTDPEIQV